MKITIQDVDSMGFPIIVTRELTDMRSETLVLSAARDCALEFNKFYFKEIENEATIGIR